MKKLPKVPHAITAALAWCRQVEQACRTQLRRPGTAALLSAIMAASHPLLAHAGIWSGGLCKAYQQILDDELITAVSMGCAAVAIIVWVIDDGKSQIKLWLLRVIAATLVLFNLPVVWGAVTSHAPSCF